jgi:outer membrane immunogenic protein
MPCFRKARLPAALVAAVMVGAGGASASDLGGQTFSSPSRISQAWAGFYVGGHLGFSMMNHDVTLTPGPSQFSINSSSLSGGLMAGLNASVTQNVILGAEADVTLMNNTSSRIINAGRYFGDADVMGTLRGRLGMTFDQFMVYGTAGMALAGVDMGGPFGRAGKSRLGFTIGAGIEANLTRNVFARVEYLFTGFGSDSYGIGANQALGGSTNMHTVRGGVGFRF